MNHRVFIWDCETFPEGDPINKERAHHMYNVGFLEYSYPDMNDIMCRMQILSERFKNDYKFPKGKIIYDNLDFRTPDSIAMNVLSYTDSYQSLYDKTTIYYGLDAEDRFVKFVKDIAEETRQKVSNELEKWFSRFHRANKTMKLERLQSARNSQENRLKRRFKVIFYAHNGGKYDSHFMLKNKDLLFGRKIIDSGGLISLPLKDDVLEFRDSMRITGRVGCALDKLCKSFGLPKEYSKTDFPHLFMSSDTIDYVGKVPPAIYWKGNKIPEQYQDKEFNVPETSCHYQRLDVVSLTILWAIYKKTFYDITGYDINKFYTKSTISYNHVMSYIPEGEVKIIQDHSIDSWIRSEIVQGGRVFPQKGLFKSKLFDEILNAQPSQLQELYRFCLESGDYLHDLDARSLYPSALSLFEYPIGDIKWVEKEEDLELVRQAINSCDTNFPICFVKCMVTFPHKHECYNVCPLLAYHLETGEMLYTLIDRVYSKTSIDLIEAVKYNKAYITKVYCALMFSNKKPIFRNQINDMYSQRKQAKKNKNKASEEGYKGMSNEFSGKLGQASHDKELIILDEEIIDENEQEVENPKIAKCFERNVSLGELLANNKQSMFEVNKKKEARITHPLHLNATMLSYSRVIMNRFINAFGGFDDWEKTFWYCDTDSLFISHTSYLELVKNIPDAIGEELGQLHDDIDEVRDGIIFYGNFLAPKFYMYLTLGYSKKTGHEQELVVALHIRVKGLKKDRQKEISREEFEDMLLNGAIVEVDNIERFATAFKKTDEPAVKTIRAPKSFNKHPWKGRIWDKVTNCYYPYTDTEQIKEVFERS